jgi:hypothetical protein
MWNLRYPRWNWIRWILPDGLKTRRYTMITFNWLLSGVFRLFIPLSSDIRSPYLLNPDQIYEARNTKIRSIKSICIRYVSGASDVTKTPGYTVWNDTWFPEKLFTSLALEDIRVYKNETVSLIGFYHPYQRRSDQNPLLASIGCEQKIL